MLFTSLFAVLLWSLIVLKAFEICPKVASIPSKGVILLYIQAIPKQRSAELVKELKDRVSAAATMVMLLLSFIVFPCVIVIISASITHKYQGSL